jgi:DNA-binding response OmpR family regulator
MRILVAKDDAALASFINKGLESEHYAVDVSSDGEQARNLPRLDGVAILRFLRTRKPSMPILVLTGRTRVEDRVLCLDLGADDYLGKPFLVTEFSGYPEMKMAFTPPLAAISSRARAQPLRSGKTTSVSNSCTSSA